MRNLKYFALDDRIVGILSVNLYKFKCLFNVLIAIAILSLQMLIIQSELRGLF